MVEKNRFKMDGKGYGYMAVDMMDKSAFSELTMFLFTRNLDLLNGY